MERYGRNKGSQAVGRDSAIGRLLEGDCIHTVPEAARRWTIGEYVAKVSVAGIADGFNPLQKAGTVEMIRDDI